MNTKILFLDFDGVVNNIGTRSGMGLNIPFKCYDGSIRYTDWGFENIGVFNKLLLWCLKQILLFKNIKNFKLDILKYL